MTMKQLTAICLALLCFHGAFAQDLITKKDGTDIRAKVLEISTNEVRYKLFDEPESATYICRKSDLMMIRFESGRKEFFTGKSYSDLYTTDREPVADITPNMKYKELKAIYNPKEYEKTLADRHSPVWSGITSAIIPGLGQMISGEVGRGFAFLGSHVGGATIASCILAAGTDEYGDISEGSAILALAVEAGILALDIYSIVDGVRVAKVKNMYEQDLRKLYAVDVNLYPSVKLASLGNTIQPTAGLTLAISF